MDTRNSFGFRNLLKKGGDSDMIIVPLKEGENIERALKRFKRKFEKQVLSASFVPERTS